MNNINVCISCDDNYAMYAGVAIASLLYNAAREVNLCNFPLNLKGASSIKHLIESLPYLFAKPSRKLCP